MFSIKQITAVAIGMKPSIHNQIGKPRPVSFHAVDVAFSSFSTHWSACLVSGDADTMDFPVIVVVLVVVVVEVVDDNDDADDDENNDHNNNNDIYKSRFFHNLFTMPRTVSTSSAHVAKVQP